MSLSAKYQRFLASPSSDALAEEASIHYVTTLTTINEPAAIIKHLSAQSRQVAKKAEKVLSEIESANGVCLDVETTLEFLTGGGAYLPGLDDNFLTDRVVTFPMIHIVNFDANGKIAQIRLHWEQGSMLRELNVIGGRARNWPIRDGKDMIRLISSSAKLTSTAPTASAAAPAQETEESATATTRPKRASASAARDPHSSLSLFEARDSLPETPAAQTVSPSKSTRPAYRGLTEILGGEENSAETPPGQNNSPAKIPVKAGGGKNFLPSRLFEEENEPTPTASPDKPKPLPKKYNHFDFGEGEDAPPIQPFATPAGKGGAAAVPDSIRTNSKKYNHFEFGEGEGAPPAEVQQTPVSGDQAPAPPESSVKTNPKKYNHFEFGEGEEAPAMDARPDSRSKKHLSQWDFEDFVTPQKPVAKVRGQDVRHFGWSDDEEGDSPVRRAIVHHPRPDAKPHFEFADDGTPDDIKTQPTRKGRQHNDGLGLYKDHIVGDDDDDEAPATKKPLSNVTGIAINNDNRRKDFGAHWDMADDSPSTAQSAPAEKKLSEDKKKVLSALDAHWTMYDDGPEQSKKENMPGTQPIKTTSNSMVGRKATTRNWGFGDDDEPEEPVSRGRSQKPADKSFWDF